MRATSLSLVFAFCLLSAGPAHADEGNQGFAGFEQLTAPVPPPQSKSLVDLAPVLLPFFNNGPVFGIPGTQVGSVWESTQLTGDWNGLRTDLARQGFFFDVYTTSGYQDVTSGGLKTGSAFFENTQISMNIDTARAGLWSGGIIHFTAQARSGDTPEDTFTVGASVPHYYGLLLPGPELSHDIYPSDYYLVQALSKEFSVVLGTISGLFLPDQTLFGDSYKYYFTNFSFNKNPMFTNFYQPTAIAALGVFVPTKWLAITGGVLDPYSKANDFGDVFKAVNLYVAPIFSYNIAGLPGQFSPAFNWSNQPHTDLSQPFGPFTSPTQIPQAVGNLLGVAPSQGLIVNERTKVGFLSATSPNISL